MAESKKPKIKSQRISQNIAKAIQRACPILESADITILRKQAKPNFRTARYPSLFDELDNENDQQNGRRRALVAGFAVQQSKDQAQAELDDARRKQVAVFSADS